MAQTTLSQAGIRVSRGTTGTKTLTLELELVYSLGSTQNYVYFCTVDARVPVTAKGDHLMVTFHTNYEGDIVSRNFSVANDMWGACKDALAGFVHSWRKNH